MYKLVEWIYRESFTDRFEFMISYARKNIEIQIIYIETKNDLIYISYEATSKYIKSLFLKDFLKTE